MVPSEGGRSAQSARSFCWADSDTKSGWPFCTPSQSLGLSARAGAAANPALSFKLDDLGRASRLTTPGLGGAVFARQRESNHRIADRKAGRTAGEHAMRREPCRKPRWIPVVFAAVYVGTAIAACSSGPASWNENGTTDVSLPASAFWSAMDPTVLFQSMDARQLIARAIWGVVPDTLHGRADPPPELIRGSAVAIADGTLLASCEAVGDRQAVGIVRHSR